jgi:hypothetical protein
MFHCDVPKLWTESIWGHGNCRTLKFSSCSRIYRARVLKQCCVISDSRTLSRMFATDAVWSGICLTYRNVSDRQGELGVLAGNCRLDRSTARQNNHHWTAGAILSCFDILLLSRTRDWLSFFTEKFHKYLTHKCEYCVISSRNIRSDFIQRIFLELSSYSQTRVSGKRDTSWLPISALPHYFMPICYFVHDWSFRWLVFHEFSLASVSFCSVQTAKISRKLFIALSDQVCNMSCTTEFQCTIRPGSYWWDYVTLTWLHSSHIINSIKTSIIKSSPMHYVTSTMKVRIVLPDFSWNIWPLWGGKILW